MGVFLLLLLQNNCVCNAVFPQYISAIGLYEAVTEFTERSQKCICIAQNLMLVLKFITLTFIGLFTVISFSSSRNTRRT